MSKKTYTALPVVPPELTARYETVMAVMSGTLTVSEGARRLGLSRNHFQSLLHRALGSMIEELGPKPGGRPPMPPRERELELETGKLRLENERLQRRVETAERILGVASGLLQGRMDRGARREHHQKKPATEDE
jgi:Helix-turn-helix domain